MINFNAQSAQHILKYQLSMWQLYCASAETIFHRMNMMSHEPSNHPEFQRMVDEKVTAGMDGWMKAGLEFNTMFWRQMTKAAQPDINQSISDGMKLHNAFMGKASKTASANAKRLRRKKH